MKVTPSYSNRSSAAREPSRDGGLEQSAGFARVTIDCHRSACWDELPSRELPLSVEEKVAVRDMTAELVAILAASSPPETVAASRAVGDEWAADVSRFGSRRARYLGRVAARYSRLLAAQERCP